ncbi:hypothetical protein H112_01253 [Trichophyton rubrum D6]|uniref:Uncharacterized protein n=3 Tax=Trichophyton TaxID=5550 RepID=F2SYL0_TRIRC|nr:uncharacterized protein TERG_07666 [Trichophyton rubrum CBS 118892]EZF26741.1 hypothetical protein H100_01246 [Trichophyton rubrum MR850]EZF45717.1 hypothetical protein H102_01242 [Trichophyton rubrum CBS 100081]EZF56420.1 hypothetical protein H103_01249 [Trichophyton rubrum CBS 288.86]EZF67003.1 hypothetical protein H104_01235 [Trichophyton rubrum CBS 289.86]EZF77643.1 hypothetical protein H105_01256 [Trichophyton soudanense CBS 452.61]EZF88350.1 hypothetical protein H110_01253 [Trichophy
MNESYRARVMLMETWFEQGVLQPTYILLRYTPYTRVQDHVRVGSLISKLWDQRAPSIKTSRTIDVKVTREWSRWWDLAGMTTNSESLFCANADPAYNE